MLAYSPGLNPISTTIAAIAGGIGLTSFTITSATGLAATTGGYGIARIAEGTANAETVTYTRSGTTLTCSATTLAHAAGDTIAFDILAATGFDTLKDDALSGYPQVAFTASGPLVKGAGVCNRGTVTSANAVMTLANGTYSGEMCRVLIDRSSTKLVTIDPAGATTINGALTFVMWAGESAYFAWNGTGWDYVMGVRRAMEGAMYLGATQTGVVTATPTKANMNAVDVDNTGLMVNTSLSKIVVQRDCVGLVQGCVVWDVFSATSSRCLTMLYKNGAQVTSTEQSAVVNSFPASVSFKKLALVAGDYLELYGYQTSGSNQGFYGSAASGANLALTETLQ